MHLKIITIYCLCADFLIAYGHKDEAQTQMTSAEVMTTALSIRFTRLICSWKPNGIRRRLLREAKCPSPFSLTRLLFCL
jgi:hypothetical protein